MRSGLHNIGEGFISGRAPTLHTIDRGFVRGPNLAAGAALTRTFTDSGASATDLTTYTFSAKNLGANTGKRVLVWVSSASVSNHAVSSITINGEATTQLLAVGNGATTLKEAAYMTTAASNSTSGDVVVTWAGTVLFCTLFVYEIEGMPTGAPAIHDSGSSHSPASNSDKSVSLDVEAGGVIIGHAYKLASETDASFTGITFDARVNRGESSQSASAGSAEFASASAGQAVSATSVFTLTALSLSP